MESSMSCMQMTKFSLSKLVMEFTGTLFLTMFFTTGMGLSVLASYDPSSDVTAAASSIAGGAGSTVLLLGLWILNIFFWKISGSHFNPAVTFAFMFRKDERKMHWKIALAYIVA